MIDIIIKYVIFEKAIEIAFDGIQKNFDSTQHELKRGDVLEWIKIRFSLHDKNKYLTNYDINSYTAKNMTVIYVDNEAITIRGAQNKSIFRLERVRKLDIVDYKKI